MDSKSISSSVDVLSPSSQLLTTSFFFWLLVLSPVFLALGLDFFLILDGFFLAVAYSWLLPSNTSDDVDISDVAECCKTCLVWSTFASSSLT
jgi:hypothetical protein